MPRERLFTVPFILVCATSFAFFTSFYFLLPTLPIYVKTLGASEGEIGLVIGTFSVTALLVRPWVGRWADERGRKLLLLVGTLIFLISSLGYIFIHTFPLLLALRLFHGAGIGFFTTAASTMVADLAPVRRRGEASGHFGTSNNLAMAIGPALGVSWLQSTNFTTLFLASAGVAAAGVLLALPLPETRPPQTMLADGQPRPRPPLLSRRVLFPALVLTSLTVTYGALVSFLPLLVAGRGLGNVGLFFTIYAGALILVRSVSGMLSDRYGRAAAILPGLALTTVAMWILAGAGSWPLLALVAVLYGAGFALVQPALMAFAIDRIGGESRGAAMGTFTAAFDVGIALGAFIGGPIIEIGSYATLYLLMGVVPLAGMAAFAIGIRKR